MTGQFPVGSPFERRTTASPRDVDRVDDARGSLAGDPIDSLRRWPIDLTTPRLDSTPGDRRVAVVVDRLDSTILHSHLLHDDLDPALDLVAGRPDRPSDIWPDSMWPDVLRRGGRLLDAVVERDRSSVGDWLDRAISGEETRFRLDVGGPVVIVDGVCSETGSTSDPTTARLVLGLPDAKPIDDEVGRRAVGWFDALVETDVDRRITRVKSNQVGAFGWFETEVVGVSIDAFLHPDDRLSLPAPDRMFDGVVDRMATIAVRIANPAGGYANAEAVIVPLNDPPASGFAIMLRAFDGELDSDGIGDRSLRLYRSVLAATSDLLMVVDESLSLQWTSPSMQRFLDRTGSELYGQRLAEHLANSDRAATARFIRGDLDTSQHRCRLLGSDGIGRWFELVSSPMSSSFGGSFDTGWLVTARDVDDRVELEERLAHQANHDHLTGLPNRAYLASVLETILADQSATHPLVTVAFLDLDRFKLINDTYGHLFGDELLIAVADRLRSSVRPVDIVVRLSGDEFVVVCTQKPPDPEVAVERAIERLSALFDEPFVVRGIPLSVTASIGVVVARPGQRNAPDLLRDADTAMYRAKEAGRGKAVLFGDGLRRDVIDRHRLEQDLRHSIVERQLSLDLQPIASLANGDWGGAEALLRWYHPHRGPIEPVRFLQIAEETGFIAELGWWVLDEALIQVAAWRRLPGRADMWVSVNVTASQIAHQDFVPTLSQLLERHGVEPAALVLELTEHSLLNRDGEVPDALDALRALGVRLAIDDFGTGYSSLSYLRDFHFDILKLDARFVAELPTSRRDRAIAEAVIELSSRLDIEVVAEGIEQVEQQDVLRELGCPMGQGFLLATPRHSADFLRELGSRVR